MKVSEVRLFDLQVQCAEVKVKFKGDPKITAVFQVAPKPPAVFLWLKALC